MSTAVEILGTEAAMNNRALNTLAILQVNMAILRMDYLDSFIPLIATVLCRQPHQKVETRILIKSITEEYGIVIPYHPMVSLLNRAAVRGMIRKNSSYDYEVVKEKVEEMKISPIAVEQTRKFAYVVERLTEFCKSRSDEPETITEESASLELLNFLDRESHCLVTAQMTSYRDDSNARYRVGSFVLNAFEKEPEIFKYLTEIAVGHMISYALTFCDEAPDNWTGLQDVTVFLDTDLCLEAIGLAERNKVDACLEIIDSLRESGASLKIFAHTYSELQSILERCINWVEHKEYDPSIAMPVLRFMVTRGWTKTRAQKLLLELKAHLYDHKITVMPIGQQQHGFGLNQYSRLRTGLVDTYVSYSQDFDPAQRELTIERDTDSLSYVHGLRTVATPTTLQEAKFIFLTGNTGLAKACRLFQQTENSQRVHVPICLTDTQLGTIMWVQSPAKLEAVNRTKLIADCYAAIQPTPQTIRKYASTIERLRAEEKISADECYMLRTHETAFALLGEKTRGDSDSYRDRTAEQILEELKSQESAKERQKYEDECGAHAITKTELHSRSHDHETLVASNRAIARFISTVVFWILCAVLCVPLLVSLFVPEGKIPKLMSTVSWWLALGGILLGTNVKGMSNNAKNFVEKKMCTLFKIEY